MERMIQVSNIEYSYKKGEKVLDDLSFDVPENSIFGFLGKNGSGKTTMIRLLLNLCSPERGKITINNEDVSPKFYPQFSNIGALIEEPSFYTQLSGRQNLTLLADYYNVDENRIDEVLKLVGLVGAQYKSVKKYSLGMKQRLGIAQSILHNPKIIVLDEPINGLDPQGIMEIRKLLLRLKEEGKTIFISSHLLSEIEKVCDSVCIIEKGRKLFCGEVSDLQTCLSESVTYIIKCDNSKKVSLLLKDKFHQPSEITTEDDIRIKVDKNFDVSELVRTLVASEISLFELSCLKNSLEEIFFEITDK